ncbi:MAG: helix-turn-helix domain-containing protein [Woeseia sp.]
MDWKSGTYEFHELRILKGERPLNTKLLSLKEFESETGLGHTKACELIRTGAIESFKIGKRRLIPQSSLQKFIESRLAEAQAA